MAATALALAAAAASAQAEAPIAEAAAPIEGIWSFNGGRVAIEETGAGTFTGTVVDPTSFARCVHAVGEEVWTGVTAQPGGSYFGLHQWFFDTDDCPPNPDLGLSAFRVLEKTDGSRFLRVCLSEPGSEEQPTIAADGEAAHAGFGCFNSELIAPLPRSAASDYATTPDLGSAAAGGSCLAGKRLRIRFRNSKNDPLEKIFIVLRGEHVKKIARPKPRSGSFVVSLPLEGLPETPITVTIRMKTVLGQHLKGKRTFSPCVGASTRSPGKHKHH